MKLTKFVLTCIAVITSFTFADDQSRLLRFPSIHGDKVVFTYAGDLYLVGVDGGVARRLTGDVGFEMFAKFSPDGKHIAFTGQYDGNTEVFMIDAEGGQPKRLTFTPTLSRDDVSDRMGPNNIVMGFTPDGRNVIFRSRMKSFNSFKGQLYKAPVSGGMPVEIQLPRGGFCSYSPDGKKLAYNRIFREFRTWKRYRGGMADDVWIYDFNSKKTVNLTKNDAQDIIPMWSGDQIYFLSDRGENKRMNLYVCDLKSKETTRLTDYDDFDIKFPSLGSDAIIFEKGGFLYRFDLAGQTVRQIPVQIKGDSISARPRLVKVDKYISRCDVSPDGKRGLFGARGDIFTVPAENGAVRNLSQSSGVHERNPIWSPDGKTIAYISDATGEDEIYVMAQDGLSPARQITKDAQTYKYRLAFSPDSKKIIWSDKLLRLRYVDLETGVITDVDTSPLGEFTDYAWSPDSRWIVYSKTTAEPMKRIYLYSVDKNRSFVVTDCWYDSFSPAFSSDGKYIFFVSKRDFNPIYSATEWNHAYREMSRIYLVTLQKDTPSPLQPISDEVDLKVKKADEKADKKGDNKSDSEKDDKQKDVDSIKVDVDGIMNRITVLPVSVSNYGNLFSAAGNLYYMRKGKIMMYDLAGKKETEIAAASNFTISANGKKMMVNSGGFSIIDLPKGKADLGKKLNLSNMEVRLDPKAEWQQIYTECWRQMREFLYVPNMHGVDWKGVYEKYKPLLKDVNHRADLTYIIGEMIGELNVGHAYVNGGDFPMPERIDLGLLGAEIKRDEKTGYFVITQILKGQNWDKSLKSPLTRIGVDAREGDYILAVDGRPTTSVDNIYRLLVNKAGRQVTLKLNDKPMDNNSRNEIVIPIADQSHLYYYNWVRGNIEKVDKATGGKVGYIHVPDMGAAGLNEFVKHFYPQLRKKALIIDVRGNGGGNVSPMLIERLRREIAMINFGRNTAPMTNPGSMIYGPMVCLADEHSASDGDLFTYQFKKYKLGKVIGRRTWGGVVGIRGSLPLLDGGQLRKPEFSRYSVDGKEWIIEGIGVSPDIYVDNDPAKEYAGIDQQLNRAIQFIQKELKTKERTIPPLPDYPVR